MIRNYLKITIRQLVKHRSYALLNIGGLTAALVIISLISLWIWDEVSWDSHHPAQGKIARVMQHQTFDGNDVQTWQSQAKQLAPALRERHGDLFDHVATSSFPNPTTLFIEQTAIKKTGLFMEPSAPHILGLNMLKGSTKSLEGFNSILLSESTAKACFGEEDAINKTLRVGNLPEMMVTGVYEDLPANSSFSDIGFVGAWAVYEKSLPEWLGWGNSWFQCYVALAENQEMASVSKTIEMVKYELTPEGEGKRMDPKLFLHPMEKWHLYEEFEQGQNVGGRIQYVWLFGLIALFVLVLACINFMNLSTARSEKRAKEVGVRKAIGSERKNLIAQFFTESVIISGISFMVSIIACWLLLPAFNGLMGKELGIPWTSPLLWGAGLLIIAFTGFLAGSYPALYLSSFRPIRVLKRNVLPAKQSQYPRKVLTVVQFTVSVSLIISTLFVFIQIQHVKTRSVGYQKEKLVIVSLPSEELRKDYEVFRRELLATGYLDEVSSANSYITNTFITNSGYTWEGKDPTMNEEFVTMVVDHEFGKSLGWEIINGRDFSKDLKTDGDAFILNETAVDYLGVADPIGLTLQRDDETAIVIGVVKNVLTQSPYEDIRPMIFRLQEENLPFAYLKLKSGQDVATALSAIGTVYKKYETTYPFDYRFVGDLHAEKFQIEERVGTLSGVFTFLAIIISCLGLYGMSLFVAERRTKEIGIRKVVGASVLTLWANLSREFLWLTLLSCLLASALAYYLVSRWIGQFSYQIELSPWVFVLASAMALTIAMTTVSYHTLRAATANPVKSLRDE